MSREKISSCSSNNRRNVLWQWMGNKVGFSMHRQRLNTGRGSRKEDVSIEGAVTETNIKLHREFPENVRR